MSETNVEKKFVIKFPEEKIGAVQKGTIKVGSQILRQLSKGVYSTPEMALKELISNAYDADAPTVRIETKSSGSALIIRDDGDGMDYKDFDEKFAYISRSPKTHGPKKTKKYKRPIIGRLGIGFIAVSTLCNTMIISSTTDQSKTKFIAVLDFSKFKRKEYEGADFYDISEYTITIHEKKPNEKSYTHIELRDLETPFRNILINKRKQGAEAKNFRNPDFYEIVESMWNTKKLFQIGKRYGPYWEFVVNLASIIPVEYFKDGPVTGEKYSHIVKPIKERVSKLKFKVFFDGMELKKPYLFPTQHALESKNYTVLPIKANLPLPRGGKVVYDGYVYSQDGGIYVDDWRGLIVRVKNTSVGIRSQNFLDYPGLSDSLYFKWTFGEIYVREGLDDAMNIDRATFKKSDPEYEIFAYSLHEKLRKVVFESVQKRWRERVKKKSQDVEAYKEKWRARSIGNVFNKPFKVEITRNTKAKPLSISSHDCVITINPKHEIFENFPRKERVFLKDVLFAVSLARERYPDNSVQQENLLYNLLYDLAKKYPKPTLKYERQKKD